MQAFTTAHPCEEFNYTFVMASGQSIILRDNETSDLEVWALFEEGMISYQGKRYGYSHDRKSQGAN